MYNAKFFRVAASLNRDSWKRFRKYVRTGNALRSEKVSLFLDRIFEAHPHFDAPWIERTQLHAKVFPDLPHSDQRLYDHLSYLYDLLEAFILSENSNQEPVADELSLADYFRRMGMLKDFHQSVRKARKKLDLLPANAATQLARYRLASQLESLYSGNLKEQARTKEDGLQEKLDTLEHHFLRVRFQYACEMLNRQNVVGTSYNTSTLTFAMQMYVSNPHSFNDDPMIGAYYRVLCMFLTPQEDQPYRALRKMLETQSADFPSNEARELYVYAQNFCIRRINQGQTDYLHYLFDLYLEMLDRGNIYEEGRLSQWDYKNIASLGLRLGKTEWVDQFIESGRERISNDYRENAYAYNRAYFDYTIRNYPAALRRLQEVEFSDVFYHLGTKTIQLKIYFELEETEALISLFSTFRTYLRRQKGISTYQRRNHLNLVKFLQQLARIREKSPRISKKEFGQELYRLKETINKEKGVSNLSWLLEQIDHLLPEI